MSLDVYLKVPGTERKPGSGIFVRENGQTKEISREDWDTRYPGRDPVVVADSSIGEWKDAVVYDANITHNLAQMAGAVGVYEHLWRPDEHGIDTAKQLIEPLRDALAELQSHPDKYMQYNPKNGWGSYDALVTFIRDYLQACIRFPDATVSVSR